MSNRWPLLVLSALSLAGCGDDSNTTADAAAADDFAVRRDDLAVRDLTVLADAPLPVMDLTGAMDLTAEGDLTGAPDLRINNDLVVPPDLTPIGMACACGGGQFCKYTIAFSCAGAGMCLQRPQICPRIFDPVCGCDGKNYDNECMANAAGTDIAKKGQC